MTSLRQCLLSAIPGVVVAIALLASQLVADPAAGVTFSGSPYSDEAWSVMGGRNQAVLGTWGVDDLRMYPVQLPFQVVLAGVFELFGAGILQARGLAVLLSVGTVVLTSVSAARHFGPVAGVVSGIALAAASLFVYYGRLAYLEPMATFWLTAGFAILLAVPSQRHVVLGVIGGTCLALAIGTKPSAAAAAIGLIAGGGAAAWNRGRPIDVRLAWALGAIALAGIAWAALVWLPQRDAIEVALRWWPTTPGSAWWDWIVYARRYLRASDGAITLTLPLIAAAAAGAWLAARRWHTLSAAQRTAIGASIGWVFLGMLLIVVTAYRPNRYVVPLLPGLAMLAGVAASILWKRLSARRTGRTIVMVALIGLVSAPGLVMWARWMDAATHRLPLIQAEVAALVGSSAAVEGGLAPAFAMRAPVPTLVVRPELGINAGDLYVSHGVRWLVANESYRPKWADAHPDEWAARRIIRCYPWGPGPETCLIRIP